MNKTINIFIPAAGFGERLRPITLHIPKPLLPILGKPVLQVVLEKVSALPVNRLGINLHHKKELIESWVKQYLKNPPSPPFSKGELPESPTLAKGGEGGFLEDKIILFHEETILGTGGALKNAERLLKEGTFLVHNSDILSDINLEDLLEHHLKSNNLATLAVHDYPEFNNVVIDGNGFLKNVGAGFKPAPANEQLLAFTGIAFYEPEFLQFLPDGASSVVDGWLKAVKEGHKVGTFETRPCWNDIGTPEAYADAVFDSLKRNGETVYIHPSTKGCENVELNGYVVIEEGYNFTGTGILRNCILLPSPLTGEGESGGEGGKIPSNATFENCIIGADFKIDLSESGISGKADEDGRRLIGAGGSDRKYYKIKRGKKTAVLMECSSNDPDFRRQIEYTNFFLNFSIPVPELIEIDFDEKKAVFEDAGDTSLYNWLKCPRKETEIEDIYRKIIDTLILLHTTATDHVAACPLLKNRLFDYAYFRWETDYFVERFLEGIRNMKADDISGLESELNSLAFKADSFPKTIIHRDFQSQNIMVQADRTLKIIDYQGARIGPSAYDVASILWDPYYRLQDNMREKLVDYYIVQIEDKFDADYFRETLLVCRLQRHMQALGAYGYLSSVKGKKYFLKYVPEGLRLLKDDISLLKNEYPELYKLVMKL
jgi:NDP-sugar pyrophosphorylase family protein/aminoglycoside/choline kinase family phosphotransferase